MSVTTDRLVPFTNSDPSVELFSSRRRRLSIKAFRGEIASLTQSEDAWVSARVVADGRLGSAFTEDLSDDSIARTVVRARENAAFVDADAGNVLFAANETGAWDESRGSLASASTDEKKELALAAERAARAHDKRIVNVPYCVYMEDESHDSIAGGSGLAKSQRGSSCGLLVSVMARSGNETQTGREFVTAPEPSRLDVEAVALAAATNALAKLGAREIDSGEFPIVFDRDTASELLGALVAGGASPFYGENIQKGRSLLARKRGTRIGSDLFTLVDNPQTGVEPIYFDGDGVATRRLELVSKGVFTTVVHNLYSATREGTQSTGSATRSRGGVGTGLHHPALENGSGTLDDLLVQMRNGILVTEVAGLHAGLNPVTGDFSLSAQGFMIAAGTRAYPVRNIVVAGNFLDLAARLRAKAGDLRENSRGIDSPSIMIEQLSVSGR